MSNFIWKHELDPNSPDGWFDEYIVDYINSPFVVELFLGSIKISDDTLITFRSTCKAPWGEEYACKHTLTKREWDEHRDFIIKYATGINSKGILSEIRRDAKRLGLRAPYGIGF